MDLHQLENRSDMTSDSDRAETSPRSRGKVKHMKAYFEPQDTRNDDHPRFISSNYQTSMQSCTSDAEVKFSKFDIHTSVEEHKVCPECGDFQTECKCKDLHREVNESQATTSSSDMRPSECSFISNVSLSTLLPLPSSSSNDLSRSDASLTLGSSHGDGKHLNKTEEKMHQQLCKVEEAGLEAGDYYKIVPEEKCTPANEVESLPFGINKNSYIVANESVSSLILFPPSDGRCSEDNIQGNQTEGLGRTSTSDILSELEKEEDYSPETARRDHNLNINHGGNDEKVNVPEEEKKLGHERNMQLKSKMKETETVSGRENLLVESFQETNTEILTFHDGVYRTVDSVSTIQKGNIDLQMQKETEAQLNVTASQYFEQTSQVADSSPEKSTEIQFQESSEDEKSYEDQSYIGDGVESDDVKDGVSFENYQDIEQMSDLSEMQQDEWMSELQDITHPTTNKALFSESLASLLSEDTRPDNTASDLKNDDLNITECKEHLSLKSDQKLLPQRSYHEYQDLCIATKQFLHPHHNDWATTYENLSDIAENESLYNENSDNVSLEESTPKLIVYGSNKDALNKVVQNQIFFQNNDKLGYLRSGKITEPDTVKSLTAYLSDRYSTQEQLANYFDELDSARCQLMQQILKKDDRIDRLKKKIDVLENEIRYINRENTVLTNILDKCSKQDNDLNTMDCTSRKNKEVKKNEKSCQQIRHEEEIVETSAEEEFLKQKCDELREKNQKINAEIASLQNVVNKQRNEYECTVMTQKQVADRICFLKEKILSAEQECKKANLIKEEYTEKGQQIILYEQRLNEVRTDLEDLKTMVQEQASQAESYKNKYHQAEQELEELKNKLETTDAHNKLMITSAGSEVQRLKDHIQEELQKLNVLTGELEAAQSKLQEESQQRCVTEQQCEELLKQVQDINEKSIHLAKELELQKNTLQQNVKHQESLKELLTDVTRRNSELKDEIALLCAKNSHLKEMKEQVEKHSLEKAVELEKMAAQVADVDKGFSVRLKREKDSGEQMKNKMEEEIVKMEREIAAYRTAARKAQEEKEAIKQMKQVQITQLTRNLEESQKRIGDLQTHVAVLF